MPRQTGGKKLEEKKNIKKTDGNLRFASYGKLPLYPLQVNQN